MAEGDFRSVCEGKSVYAFQRAFQGQALMTVCNMCSKEAPISEPAKQSPKIIADNYAETNASTLKAFEFRLLSQ